VIRRINEILRYCLLLGLTFAEGSNKRDLGFEWDPEGNRKERIKNLRSLLPAFTIVLPNSITMYIQEIERKKTIPKNLSFF